MPDKEIENEADVDLDNNPSIEKIDDKSNDQSDAEKSGSLDKPNNIDAEIGEAPTQNKPDKDSENETNGKNIQPEDEHDTDITNQEDIEELTLNEIDIPIDEFDEDEEKTGAKRKWLLIGSSIVLTAVIAGGGFFYFSNQDQTNKNNRNKEVALSLKIPGQSKLKKGRKKMISSSQKLLKKDGSLEKTRQEALAWAEIAKSQLALLPKGEFNTLLLDLTDFIVDRVS